MIQTKPFQTTPPVDASSAATGCAPSQANAAATPLLVDTIKSRAHPIFDAAESGTIEQLRAILAQGGEMPLFDGSGCWAALDFVLCRKDEAMALLLLDSPLGDPALYAYCGNRLINAFWSETVTRTMIERGFSVNGAEADISIAGWCAINGVPGAMATLAKNGTDLHAPGRALNTMMSPIHLAATHLRIDMVEHLLSIGLPLAGDTQESSGESVFHLAQRHATASGPVNAVQGADFARLLAIGKRCGIPADTARSDGQTVLHYACASLLCVPLIAPLLDAGADPKKLDGFGDTPMALAKLAGNSDALAIIDAFLARQAIASIAGKHFPESQP